MKTYITSKNITRNHIDPKLLKRSIKLTLEIIMMTINKTSITPLNKSVVDQTWNCKKIETINKITIKSLFLGSTLCVKVLNGEYKQGISRGS